MPHRMGVSVSAYESVCKSNHRREVIHILRNHTTTYIFYRYLFGFVLLRMNRFHYCHNCDMEDRPDCMALSMCYMRAMDTYHPITRFISKMKWKLLCRKLGVKPKPWSSL